MGRRADLNPPLGQPGGPCHVIRRIRDEVDDQRLEDTLVHQVEKNKDLSNPDAAQVYDLDVEAGIGQFKQMVIGPHAQYRMDLRAITVDMVRQALANFQKQMNDWKSQRAYEYKEHSDSLAYGEPIEWMDRKTGLTVILKGDGAWRVKLITTYPTGKPDPKYRPGQCVMAYRTPDLSNYQTFVKDPLPGMESEERAADAEKERALPSPPWTTSKPTGQPQYSVPSGSDGALDGRPLSTERTRTLAVPGEDSPHPNLPATGTIVRRPGLTSAVKGKPYPGTDRQHEQAGEAKVYQQTYYHQNKGRIRTRVEKWQTKHENSSAYKKDRERRREHPERFERKPSGVRDPADRTREWREENQKTSEEVTSYTRQRRQRGIARTKSHREYIQNRAQNLIRSRQRYRRMRNNPMFKRRQQLRREHPERFRRRLAESLTAPEIAFVLGSDLHIGYVHGISPMSGMVTYHYEDAEGTFSRFRSAPIELFLNGVVFLSDGDITAMFDLLDDEFGGGGDHEDIQLDPLDSEDVPERRAPGMPNDYVYGQVPKAVREGMLYEKRPPEMDPYQVYDRANGIPPGSHDLTPGFDGGQVQNNPGSAKVIPEGHDFQNKSDRFLKEAARISEIISNTSAKVHGSAKGVSIKLRRVDAKNLIWAFEVPGSEGMYKVRVKAIPGKGASALDKADVQVSCSCPFWRWQGPEHWAKRNGYLYGKPVGTATRPDAKDPEGKHWACKHVIAVLNKVRTFASPKSKPRGRFASLHYLADTLASGGAIVPDYEAAVRVAARYLEGRRF